MAHSVILIDDEPWALKDMEMTFPWEENGFYIAGRYQSGREALAALLRTSPSVVCTDLRLMDISGIEILSKARAAGIGSIFIVISGYSEFELARQAMHYGAIEYCLKPLNSEYCESAVLRVRELLGDPVSAPQITGKLAEITDYITTNLDKKLTLKSVSERFFISPNTLCRMFRLSMNMTFVQYVESKRLGSACRLLANTLMPVSEIAEIVGFSDSFYFSNLFKRRLKETPTQYRRRLRDGAADGEE